MVDIPIGEKIEHALQEGNYQSATRMVQIYAIEQHVAKAHEATDKLYLARAEIALAENIAREDSELKKMIDQVKEVVYTASIAEELQEVRRLVEARRYHQIQEHSARALIYGKQISRDVGCQLEEITGFWYDHNAQTSTLDSSFISDNRLEGINEILEGEGADFRIGPGYEIEHRGWDCEIREQVPHGLGIYIRGKHMGEQSIEKSVNTAWQEWREYKERE